MSKVGKIKHLMLIAIGIWLTYLILYIGIMAVLEMYDEGGYDFQSGLYFYLHVVLDYGLFQTMPIIVFLTLFFILLQSIKANAFTKKIMLLIFTPLICVICFPLTSLVYLSLTQNYRIYNDFFARPTMLFAIISAIIVSTIFTTLTVFGKKYLLPILRGNA